MSKPEEGLYVARVTEDGERRMYVDENAVCDNQMRELFEGRNKAQEDAEKLKKEEAQRLAAEAEALDRAARQADKQAKKQKCRRNRMIKDVAGFIAAAGLAVATYVFGMYVLVAVVTGCTVAAVARVVGYVSVRCGE